MPWPFYYYYHYCCYYYYYIFFPDWSGLWTEIYKQCFFNSVITSLLSPTLCTFVVIVCLFVFDLFAVLNFKNIIPEERQTQKLSGIRLRPAFSHFSMCNIGIHILLCWNNVMGGGVGASENSQGMYFQRTGLLIWSNILLKECFTHTELWTDKFKII